MGAYFDQLPKFHESVHPKVSLEDLNALCREHTAFDSFSDLLNAKGGYRPSLDCRNPHLVILADCYDQAQLELGDSRRAYRYGVE